MAKRKGRARSPGIHLIGLFGLLCLAAALYQAVARQRFPADPAAQAAVHSKDPPRPLELRASPYYPLEVGRYWVYRYEDPRSGLISRIERRVERRERRGERELFFFDDGMVVYRQAGRIFEMGGEGGVNVIPLEAGRAPYIYRSQGLHIEKRLGAVDTTLVVEGRRFEHCLEVVTRFRAAGGRDAEPISYSSYYARGIGLVGRQRWPRTRRGELSFVLYHYGVTPQNAGGAQPL